MDLRLPTLPYNEWKETKITLHLYLQIVGKIHLALHPKKNHWWHVTYHLTARGLTTGPIPYDCGLFAIEFDLLNHQLVITTSQNDNHHISLLSISSVADFYQTLTSVLYELGITVKINPIPFDPTRVKSDIPFEQDDKHHHYDPEHVSKYFQILTFIYPVFQEFNGRFLGKTTPIHVFWHTFDLALTRFSGRAVAKEKLVGMDSVSKEAYSHEVISFGFWSGDDNLPEPTFYSYTFPEPKNLSKQPLLPENASWQSMNGSSLAILKYHDLMEYKNPKEKLLKFLESAYQAGATLANWDIKGFEAV